MSEELTPRGDSFNKFRRLQRKDGAMLGGVCAGLAYAFMFPVWAMRLFFLIAIVVEGAIFLVYLVLWIVVQRWDEKPHDFEKMTGD